MRDMHLEIDHAEDMLNRLREGLRSLSHGELEKARAKAVNTALKAVMELAAGIPVERYTDRPSQMFKRIQIQRAAPGRIQGSVRFIGRRGYSLFHFHAQPGKPGRLPAKGVTAHIRKAGMRKAYTLPGYDKPFVMKQPQGGYGIFVGLHGQPRMTRRGNTRRGKIRKWKTTNGVVHESAKWHVEKLWGPSPIQSLTGIEAETRMRRQAEEIMADRLAREIEKLVAKMGR